MTREEYLRYGLETELLKFSEYLELTRPLKLPEGLEEAAEEFTRSEYSSPCAFGGENIEEWVSRIFIAGAEWDRAKMMEKAVEGRVATYDNGRIRIYTELLDGTIGLHFGDKVKIIVIPEE